MCQECASCLMGFYIIFAKSVEVVTAGMDAQRSGSQEFSDWHRG